MVVNVFNITFNFGIAFKFPPLIVIGYSVSPANAHGTNAARKRLAIWCRRFASLRTAFVCASL